MQQIPRPAQWLRHLAWPLLALACASAQASSSDSWKELEKRTSKACLKKSELKHPKVKGQSVMFETHVLYVIQGIHPAPVMNGAKVTTYCLHPIDGDPQISNSPIPS